MGFRNVIGIMGDRNDGAKKRIITGAGKFSTEMEELVRLVLILLKHTLAWDNGTKKRYEGRRRLCSAIVAIQAK